jgi:hypothetical protein
VDMSVDAQLPRYVAAFRTYAWDEDIAELARRFFAAVPSARQVVLVDETRGPIEIPGYEKVSHTTDVSSLGLLQYPNGPASLWFNVDYGIYFLERALPDFDYYLLSESDLAVNVDLEPMMGLAAEQGIDLIAHKIELSTPDWFWHGHGLALSAQPWQSRLYFMVLSHRTVEYLLAARRRLGERFALGEIGLWPFCEAFVPTVLKSTPEIKLADVSQFADTENLAFRPWLSLRDPRANRPGSLAHSVLGGRTFINRLLSKHPARDFFREGSELRMELLGLASIEDIIEPVRRALARERDHSGVALLYQEALQQGWSVRSGDDLAFCKPALSSSVCGSSRYPDPGRDACGANGDPLDHDYGFHTNLEENPWWQVDLLEEYPVEEIAIVNRRTVPGRFNTFRIETSCDGESWATRFTQSQSAEVSSDLDWPLRVVLAEAVPARYVRIVLLGREPLHLRRVQVFAVDTPLGGKRLIGRLLGRFPARDFFQEGSELRQGLLGQAPAEDVVEPLRRLLAAERDHVGIALLYKEALQHGWSVRTGDDLAWCKPALSSSVCGSSRYPDPERDACGANGEPIAADYGFHTNQEENPWWQVDLLEDYPVEEVAIVNRRAVPERFVTFRIDTSCDGRLWTTRFTQARPREVSSELDWPLRVVLAEAVPARYVRIVLLGREPLHLRRVQVFAAGAVAVGKRYVGRLLAQHPARDFFRQGSELRQGLLSQPALEVIEPLRRVLAREHDHAGVALLRREADLRGWGFKPSDDLAFCKPALSSSVSRWSRYPDPERDACCANGESILYDYAFHTDKEVNPWWRVDLLEEHIVEEIAIVNRLTVPQRFRRFRIESSRDGDTWSVRFTQAEPCDVSSNLNQPHRVRLTDPAPVRYLRIVLLATDVLHLRRVQVFGRSPTSEDSAQAGGRGVVVSM